MNVSKMKRLHSLLVGLSVLAVSTLSAQPAPGGGPRGPGPHGPGPGGHRGPGGCSPIVRALDGDKDGEISAAELANASASILTLDANQDGAVSAAEMRPVRPANAPTPPADAPARPAPPAGARSRPQPIDPIMLALDANTDGDLSAAEIANAAKSLAALDANKDGKLTRDEVHPLPPKAE